MWSKWYCVELNSDTITAGVHSSFDNYRKSDCESFNIITESWKYFSEGKVVFGGGESSVVGAKQGASGNFLGLQRVNERASAGSGGPTALKKGHLVLDLEGSTYRVCGSTKKKLIHVFTHDAHIRHINTLPRLFCIMKHFKVKQMCIF